MSRPRTRSARPEAESDESTLQQSLNEQPGTSETRESYVGFPENPQD
jgi:hypothetical protein